MTLKRAGLLAGNFKMNLGVKELSDYLNHFLKLLGNLPDQKNLVICPQAPLLANAVASAKSKFSVGSQNIGLPGNTAQTGELAPPLLKEMGVTYAIVGHSERRAKFGESSRLVAERVLSAQANGITPILCIGETLQEREGNQTEQVLATQLKESLPANWLEKPLVLAYEPVWAIGTGKTATPKTAQETHAWIRTFLKKEFGEKASQTTLLYGGSVTPENFEALMSESDIDGGLVGGASLKPDSFFKLAEIFLRLES